MPKAGHLNRAHMRSCLVAQISERTRWSLNGIADRNKGGFHRCPAGLIPESHV